MIRFFNRAKVRAFLWQLVKLRHSLRRTAYFDTSLPIIYRKETKVELFEVGASRPFVKTFQYDGDCINAYHCALANAPVGGMGIPFCIDIGLEGYLDRSEAMKLYELSYFAEGDVLELGTFRGLSASIFARSLEDSGSGGRLDTCDINQAWSDLAKQKIASLPGADRVTFHVKDAAVLMDELKAAGRQFGIIFIDHWHGYDTTRVALERTPPILRSGGFVIMHDYNDPHTLMPEHPHKVFQAVHDTIGVDSRFEFICVVASIAVYRKKPD
jgi:predicted O-methyltransferase YrrM